MATNIAATTVLAPHAVNKRVSQLKVVNDTFQAEFGMGQGGRNEQASPYGRRGSYDTFNETRDVPDARFVHSTSGTVAKNPVGNVPFVIPRHHDKIPILFEVLNGMRPIGGPVGTIDRNGESYILNQEKYMRQRVVNLREFQLSAMLRGSYTYTISGDRLTHGYSGGTYTVDFKVPSGNKTQLNMLAAGSIITVSWLNNASKIVDNLFSINAALINLTGRGIRDIWLTSVMWGNIINNTQVINEGGAFQRPFEFIRRDEAREDFVGQIRAAPWINFHITDNGLSLQGTFTKLIPDTAISVLPNMDGIAEYWTCGETVVKGWLRQEEYVQGDYYYYDLMSDPAGYALHTLANGLPIVYIPKGIVFGTATF
jgi:hypothetical protein